MTDHTSLAALRFAPLVPSWLLISLAVLALIAVGLAGWRRGTGVTWRALCFTAILLWLAGPRLVHETRQGQPDIALLVIDQSASMTIADRAAMAAQARAALEKDAAEHQQELGGLDLRILVVPEAGNSGTQLFAAIDHALADIQSSRLAGVVMVTDGQVHDIPKSLPGGVPLHVLLTSRGEETDRRVRIVSAPGYGIVGQSVKLRAVVEDLGVAASLLGSAGSTKLTIRRDGEAPVEIMVPIGQETDIDIPITRAGPSVVELAADALPGAVSDLNRREVLTINGVRDRLRVLLVSGEPHQGERTWRRLLKADPSVDLVHFTILRPPEKDDLTPINELALIAFPVRELFQVKIREFDLIILDRFTNRGLLPAPYLRNIADYVRGGGALLVSAGPEFAGPGSPVYTPLGEVIPARPLANAINAANESSGVLIGAFRPMVTDLGTRHPISENLPGWHENAPPDWGNWYRAVATSSVRGDVLMRLPSASNSGGAPLLVADRVGQGRVALLLSDQIWLWSRGHQGGGPQAELLRRVAHWLMQEPELDETALTAHVENGYLTVERRSMAETPPDKVVVTDPGGTQIKLPLSEAAPSRFNARMPASTPGVWQINDGTRVTFAAAGAANRMEFADLRATADLLAPLAKASNGSLRFLGSMRSDDGAPKLRRTAIGGKNDGSGWIGLPRREDDVVIGVTALSLFPPALALPLILGLAVLAWRREGRGA